MENILQAVLDVPGVGAAMVLDGGGRLVAHRGRAVYDRSLCEQLGASLTRAVDAVQLQQEDWESMAARYADGKLLVRNLGAVAGVQHVLAVVADSTLNPSFATVAIRVASNKLKKVLSGAGASSSLASSVGPMSASVGPMSASTPVTGSLPLPPRPADTSPALASSGLSWSQTSSVGLSRVPVADPASSAFLTRAAKELARHVGPMAKVYVEEGVRRVCPDAPFSLAAAARLIEDLAGQIEDGADRAQFRKAVERMS
ncbi:MAG TPA: roadblock/LC7 domain-containing protein [Anaeromyxobacteraceae bacterium]|nr:roadblock/LC7 domain-containing protein [Anaeromyxobacteraceae bacterium]